MVDRQELLNSTGQIETNQLARDSRLELFHTEPSNHCTRAYDMMLYRVHSFCYGQDTKDHLLNLTLPTKGSKYLSISYIQLVHSTWMLGVTVSELYRVPKLIRQPQHPRTPTTTSHQ
jgi:hypothetical protein